LFTGRVVGGLVPFFFASSRAFFAASSARLRSASRIAASGVGFLLGLGGELLLLARLDLGELRLLRGDEVGDLLLLLLRGCLRGLRGDDGGVGLGLQLGDLLADAREPRLRVARRRLGLLQVGQRVRLRAQGGLGERIAVDELLGA